MKKAMSTLSTMVEFSHNSKFLKLSYMQNSIFEKLRVRLFWVKMVLGNHFPPDPRV